MKALSIFLLVFSMISTYQTSKGQNTCLGFYKYGYFDTSTITDDRSYASSMITWYRTHNFSSYGEAKSASFSVGLPLDAALNSLGFSNDESGWGEFRRYAESYLSSSEASQSKFVNFTSTIRSDALQKFNDCVNADGLKAWIELTDDPMHFRIAAKFRSPGIPLTANISSFEAINAECDGEMKPWLFSLFKPTITGSTLRTLCSRSDSGAVAISINADIDLQGGKDLSLPSLRRVDIVVPAPIEEHLDPEVNLYVDGKDHIVPGKFATIGWVARNAERVEIDNGIGTISDTGTRQVSPSQTTTYTLTAYSGNTVVRAKTTVTINPLVRVWQNPNFSGQHWDWHGGFPDSQGRFFNLPTNEGILSLEVFTDQTVVFTKGGGANLLGPTATCFLSVSGPTKIPNLRHLSSDGTDPLNEKRFSINWERLVGITSYAPQGDCKTVHEN